KDNLAVAVPILERHALPACFFLTTSYIGTDTVPLWDAKGGVRSEWLNWDDVADLSRKGFEIGAHTMSHPDLGHIDGESAEHEILGSRRRLEEELGEPVTLFAYPFGGRANLSEANRERVRRAGYRCCMSAYGGVVDRRTDRYDVPRVAVDRWFRSPYHWGLVLLLGRDRQGAR